MLIITSLLAQIDVGSMPNPALIPTEGTLPGCSFVSGDLHFQCVPLYIGFLIKLVFGFTGGIALMEIIKGGYKWAFSDTLSSKENAIGMLRSAIVGFVLSILAFTLVDMIVSVVL